MGCSEFTWDAEYGAEVHGFTSVGGFHVKDWVPCIADNTRDDFGFLET